MGAVREPPPLYSSKSERKAKRFFDYLLHRIVGLFPTKHRNQVAGFIVSLITSFLICGAFITYVIVPLDYVQGFVSNLDHPKVVTPISPPTTSLPRSLKEARVQESMKDGCNTSNNFEPNIWDTQSMRVIETDSDTGDPVSYGVQKNESYQSLMVYKVRCPLPLVATVSAEMQSQNSLGLIFEYDNIFQVIVGDGDTRSIRYKVHNQEKRQLGWEYVYGNDGKKITHWLPVNQKIAPGSEIGLTVEVKVISNQEIQVEIGLSYMPMRGFYTSVDFPPVMVQTYKYDTAQNIGRFIRVGLNDFSFEGNEAIIAPLHFSVRSNFDEK